MDYSVINNGTYPAKPYWRSPLERWCFIGMLLFSVAIYFQIACWYVYGAY